MSKKNYIAIARIILHAKEQNNSVQWIQQQLGIYFKQDNPNFDAHRFNEACTPEPIPTVKK